MEMTKMKTEEKTMVFDTSTWQRQREMNIAINEQLGEGWKIKPATFHTMHGGTTIICLYREIPHIEIEAGEED